MSIKVIDNFLSKKEHQDIKNIVCSNHFPWFLNVAVNDFNDKNVVDVVEEKYNFQFTHMFYEDFYPKSNYIDILLPIIKKINPSALIRIKANMNIITEKNIEHGFHIDFPFKNSKTAIYYLNSNDGYTIFKNGEKIMSVENRFIEFDSDILHSGSTQTDSQKRVLINFNYFI